MTTTEPHRTERQGLETRFIDFLRGLVDREERAELAALRRGLGKEPGTTPEMYPYVVPFLPKQPRANQEAAYYLVAALFAWHQKHTNDDRYTNLGASLADFRWQQTVDRGEKEVQQGDSTERRFVAMLSSTREDLPYHLRQMIGLLRTKEVPVNWLQLLSDIQHWDDDTRRDRYYRNVQRRWATAFWGNTSVAAATDDSTSNIDQSTDTESDTDEE